jgi:nucleoside-diphosphate-sugar epimerase
MRIFVAGATGTLGRAVVHLLLSHGHEVVGLSRSPERARGLVAAGMRPVVANALNAHELVDRIAATRPEAIVHLLTASPPTGPLRKAHLSSINELRSKATRTLIDAAVAVGARRFVAESFVGVYGLTSSGPLSLKTTRYPSRAGSSPTRFAHCETSRHS